MKFFQVKVALALVFLHAQLLQGAPPHLKDDPKRPVAKISQDLGVEPAQFRNCFKDVNPAAEGSRPSGEQKRKNKGILLSCLQKANPDITNEMLDEVMDRYRPGGHKGQESAE